VDGDRKPIPLSLSQFQAYGIRVSPDGKWIVSAAADTGNFEIYVQPFNGPGARKQISQNGGIHPRWRGDGKELFFWQDNPGNIMSVAITETPAGLQSGVPVSVLPTSIVVPTLYDSRSHYGVTRDGQRFLLRQLVGRAGDPIQIITNWPKLLQTKDPQ
jgi:Tol biopolymer transport system component